METDATGQETKSSQRSKSIYPTSHMIRSSQLFNFYIHKYAQLHPGQVAGNEEYLCRYTNNSQRMVCVISRLRAYRVPIFGKHSSNTACSSGARSKIEPSSCTLRWGMLVKSKKITTSQPPMQYLLCNLLSHLENPEPPQKSLWEKWASNLQTRRSSFTPDGYPSVQISHMYGCSHRCETLMR